MPSLYCAPRIILGFGGCLDRNRSGQAADKVSKILIATSDDAKGYRQLFAQSPHRYWRCPCHGRYIRCKLGKTLTRELFAADGQMLDREETYNYGPFKQSKMFSIRTEPAFYGRRSPFRLDSRATVMNATVVPEAEAE